MELRVLRYFLMVAREENITKTAELLHITQPTLSRQLAQLEEELGVQLFRRGKYRITLTEDGMLLKRRAQEIVDLADKTIEDFKRDDKELSGKISIGSAEFKSMHVFAEWISKFHEKYPNITFDIYSGTADEIKDQLDKGLLDIAFLGEPVDLSRYMFIRLSENIKWGVLVRKDSSIAKKEYAKVKDLIDFPILIPKRLYVQNEISNWFKDDFDKLNIVGTFNLLNNAAILVEKLNGAAITMELDVMYKDMVFVPFEPILNTGSVLVWKQGQIFSNHVNAFIKFLRNA